MDPLLSAISAINLELEQIQEEIELEKAPIVCKILCGMCSHNVDVKRVKSGRTEGRCIKCGTVYVEHKEKKA